jgi:XTP/dITP diphosphohydrolase
MQEIVIASDNAGKLVELQALLQDIDMLVRPQGDFRVPAIEETGLTFVENAILKARNAAQHTGLPALADDSGIEVDALNGAPGIYSARYAAPKASEQNNREKLLQVLADVPQQQRSARFQCVLVYMRHAADPTPLICQGTWAGRIALQPAGSYGFGYDPVFYPDGLEQTAAELPPEQKNRLSHRAQALAQLKQLLVELLAR